MDILTTKEVMELEGEYGKDVVLEFWSSEKGKTVEAERKLYTVESSKLMDVIVGWCAVRKRQANLAKMTIQTEASMKDNLKDLMATENTEVLKASMGDDVTPTIRRKHTDDSATPKETPTQTIEDKVTAPVAMESPIVRSSAKKQRTARKSGKRKKKVSKKEKEEKTENKTSPQVADVNLPTLENRDEVSGEGVMMTTASVISNVFTNKSKHGRKQWRMFSVITSTHQ